MRRSFSHWFYNRTGFTIIELLIMFCIIGILSAIVIPIFVGEEEIKPISKNCAVCEVCVEPEPVTEWQKSTCTDRDLIKKCDDYCSHFGGPLTGRRKSDYETSCFCLQKNDKLEHIVVTLSCDSHPRRKN